MAITHNLGRINNCKIVGTKNRFIETRCAEQPCTQNCWECINGNCVAQVGGSFNTEADCLANPLVNSCVTAGLTNTGVYGYMPSQYDYLATAGHHAVSISNFYFETFQPCGGNASTTCIGPNGGCFVFQDMLNVYDASNINIIYSTDIINDLVTYLATQGITILPTNDYFTINLAIYNSTSGILKGGSLGISGDTCVCNGCGVGPAASWECYTASAGSYCADPLDGSGQYANLTDCNAALSSGTNSTCNTNGPSSSARTLAVAGTVFSTYVDAFEYYTNPANGLSGTDAMTLKFEVLQDASTLLRCSNLPSTTTCCEGPNSTIANPTVEIYLRYMAFFMPYDDPASLAPTTTTYCCPNPASLPASGNIGNGIQYVPFLQTNADYGSWYGNDGLNNNMSWTWDEILTDAMAGGVTGVDMTTPWTALSTAGSFMNDVSAWMSSIPNPVPCVQNTCDTILNGTNNGITPFCSSSIILYDWYASNVPNDTFTDWYGDAGIACGVPAGSQCTAPSGGTWDFISTVHVRDGSNTIIGSISGGTQAVADFLNAYVGGNISTATGSMTQASINTLIASSTGNLAGGSIAVAFSVCTCNNNMTWYFQPCTNNYQGPYAVVCNMSISDCFEYDICLCEESCSNITYECDLFTGCYDPFPLLGTYTGATALADCQAVCNPARNLPSWDCTITGVCFDPGNGTGVYTDANSGGNPGDGLIACNGSGGVDTCASKTDSLQYTSGSGFWTWMSQNQPTSIISQWKWEDTSYVNSDCPLGPNGGAYAYAFLFTLTDCTTGQPVVQDNTVNGLVTQAQGAGCSACVPGMTYGDMAAAWSASQGYTNNCNTMSLSLCKCSPCSPTVNTDPWECVTGAGCIQIAGGQYSNEADCLSSSVFVNSCDSLDRIVDSTGLNIYAADMPQLQEWITNQSNLYTNVDVTTLFTHLSSSWEANACLPAIDPILFPCANINLNGYPQIAIQPWIVYDGNTGATLPGFQASYTKWDDFLSDAISIPVPNITATTQFAAALTALQIWGNGLSLKAIITQDYTCCDCTGGCPPPEPRSKACLVLWLDAEQSSIEVEQPPALGGMQNIEKWYNKAYDGLNLPFDLTAYYTWDTIDNLPLTAPTFDTVSWPFPTVRFTNKNNYQYLIANTGGPAAPRLQPDTSDATHNNGWSLFFHRSASATEWINSKSWFMGDDWTVSDDPNKNKASGIKPQGQPYCKSNLYGHNHADSTIPSNEFESSSLNEVLNTGHRTLKSNTWYLHWIIAEEQLPYGSDLFDVRWGVGNVLQFKDTIKGVNLDMVIANINTRNRAKDGFAPGQGFFSEIRAYDCAFDQQQLNTELNSFETKYGYGTLNIPLGLPQPCGDAFITTKVDGVDGTLIKVIDNDNIAPSVTGFTAAFWVKINSCPGGGLSNDSCLFEKGLNLPIDNEDVSFRLFMTDEPGYAGILYWDVFGDNPVDYNNNYSRRRSSIAWLGDGSCAGMVGKWHHIAVTVSGVAGNNKRIYIDGVDRTGVGAPEITGNIITGGYPLNIGDSSRVDFTTDGSYGPFITWNTELDADKISMVYANGDNFFNPLVNVDIYQDKDFVSFYSKMESDPSLDLSIMNSEVQWVGGVTLNKQGTDPVDAGLPTDIPGLDFWLKAGTKMLADQDKNGNTISRADYMIGNSLEIGDKIAIWECYANKGKYCAQVTQSYKPKYEGDGTSAIVKTGVYTDSTDRLQIYNTRADGGINIDSANGITGAFNIMWRVSIDSAVIAAESFMGDTAVNFIRMNDNTEIRVKLGGGVNRKFILSSGNFLPNTEYIFTLDRDKDGLMSCYVDGGTFTDLLIGQHTETNATTIDNIIGIPSIGMSGWFFDLMVWKHTASENFISISSDQRQAMYRVMREQIRVL